MIREVDDQQAAAIALVENLQREDLNPLEEARAFSNLIENFSLTHQEIGEAVGRSRAAVSNSLRLLALSAPVQEMLNRGQIEMGMRAPCSPGSWRAGWRGTDGGAAQAVPCGQPRDWSSKSSPDRQAPA